MEFGNKATQVWIPFYRVEKVLTFSNYLIRKTGTTHTHCVHQFRQKQTVPQQTPEDLESINPAEFITDPSLGKFRSEPELFDVFLPRLLGDVQPSSTEAQLSTQQPARVRLTI